MPIKATLNYTLVFANLTWFALIALLFSVPFWQIDYFDKIMLGNPQEITKGIIYLLVFIALPLCVLSLMTTKMEVVDRQLKIVDCFGLRKRKYSLQDVQHIGIKNITSQYFFHFLPKLLQHKQYRKFSITTADGIRIHIKSKYYKNFEELNIAVRKAAASVRTS